MATEFVGGKFFDYRAIGLSPGAALYTYQAGTLTPQASYTNAGGGSPNANPVILNAFGQADVYLDPALTYRFRLYTDLIANGGTLLWDVDNIVGSSVTAIVTSLAATSGASLIGYIQSGAGAVAQTVQSRLRNELLSTDYSTLQALFTAGAGKAVRIVAGAYALTAAATLSTGTSVSIDDGATISTSTPGISLFLATGQSNITITGGGKFLQTASDATAYVAAIKFDSCTDCVVQGPMEYQGMQWSGVFFENNCVRCTLDGGYFHDWLGTVLDSAAATIYRNSSDCTVKNITAVATGCFGVHCQDPGGVGTYKPQRNKTLFNRIFNVSSYGITNYIGGSTDTNNEIAFNHVEGVTGLVGTSTGSAIYAVGSGGGGLRIHHNTCINCVINTIDATNIHGGVSLSDNIAANSPIYIGENTIKGFTQGHGIVVNNCDGVAIGPNQVMMPSTNDGTGPGGATYRGNALRIQNSQNVSRVGGVYRHNGVLDAIIVITTSGSMVGHEHTGGVAISATGCPFRTSRTGADTIELVMTGGNYKTTSNTSNAVQLQGLVESNITGVRGSCGTQAALALTDCQSTNINDGRWKTTGATGVSTTGTCTGSFYGLSNRHNGVISNLASGVLTQFYASGAPGTGSAQISDLAEQVASAIGSPKRWRCTTAGSPGTWTSEGNL